MSIEAMTTSVKRSLLYESRSETTAARIQSLTNDDEMVAPTGVDNGERDSSTSPTATTITTSTSHGDLEERLRGSAQMAQRFSKMEL
ncbi:unnamed protein product [Hymenolepis diminuta]|uniref:Uncharacterized protein n=1 Tax=Hymenolepis diminuta TaxID=6216 RepID=A0A564Y5Q6_HYMDI|nr:unnamed protein product [Hymenolepis diminuta]